MALRGLFQAASNRFASGGIAFIDAGYYKVSDTVTVPPNIRIVGEAMAAVILGVGSRFSDINKPYPVVQIGRPGQVGYVELSDLIVSTQGATAGAVLIEYNLDTPISTTTITCHTGQPPSGLWDVHVRIGGFAGSGLQVDQCLKTPSVTTVPNPACIAAYMSFHITRTASNLYIENSWLWVADHDIEDPNNTQINVFAGRGLLIEASRGRIWLVGTAVEHHTLYQYQLLNTNNIWMGHIQTETPYYQPNPPAPYPFTSLNTTLHDPDFNTDCRRIAFPAPCSIAWGLRCLGSSNIVVFGAGLYSFFNNYSTNCSTAAAGENCQSRISWTGPAGNVAGAGVVMYNLDTIGSVNMFTHHGSDFVHYRDNFATFASTVALLWA